MFRDRRIMNPGGNEFKMKWLLAVSVGAGLMLGAAGVFLYDHYIREKRRLLLQNEMMRLDLSVAELRRELEEFRSAHLAQWRKRRQGNRRGRADSSATASETDAMSVIDEDEDFSSDEFFDLSDSEFDDYAPRYANILSSSVDVDPLLRSTSRDDKLIALERMRRENDKEENSELLWRMAQACHRLAIHELTGQDSSVKEEYIAEGLGYATRCLEIAPRSADAHKWYAICIGARAETQPIKDKIKDGMAFQKHVLQALEVRPEDPTLNHLIGRFNYELATLSWMERKVATALFGEMPNGKMSDAVDYLLKAEELHREPWKENRLILAKAYIYMGNYSQAVRWLRKAADAPVMSTEDDKAQKEVEQLLEKYKKYQ